jgi:nucleotide-binding universal stress UspA family protein
VWVKQLEVQRMPSDSRRFGILVGVDRSNASDAAVRWAAEEAQMRKLPITLVHVIAQTPTDSTGPRHGGITQEQLNLGREIVEQSRRIVEEFAGRGVVDVGTQVPYAHPVPTLVDASRSAHMIAVGDRGLGGFGRHLLGSVSFGLLHHAHCPVAVIHDRGSLQQHTDDAVPVLVGIDGSPASEAAVAFAFDEASSRAVPLIALHAWSDVGVFPILGMDWHTRRDEGEQLLGERLAGWQEQFPDVPVHRRLVCDVPARWLIEESGQAQLVVLGSHGRGGYPGMHLGSVTSSVTQSADVPVVVTRGDL